jgi:hypothetical protein
MIAGFGKTTQKEFDEAHASIPDLIHMASEGNEAAGVEANNLLWGLANESVNTQKFCPATFQTIYQFGNKE